MKEDELVTIFSVPALRNCLDEHSTATGDVSIRSIDITRTTKNSKIQNTHTTSTHITAINTTSSSRIITTISVGEALRIHSAPGYLACLFPKLGNYP